MEKRIMEYATNQSASNPKFRAPFRSPTPVVGDAHRAAMTRIRNDKVAFDADVVALWCEESQARAELDGVMYETASELTTGAVR
jgi:hypothetical protein